MDGMGSLYVCSAGAKPAGRQIDAGCMASNTHIIDCVCSWHQHSGKHFSPRFNAEAHFGTGKNDTETEIRAQPFPSTPSRRLYRHAGGNTDARICGFHITFSGKTKIISSHFISYIIYCNTLSNCSFLLNQKFGFAIYCLNMQNQELTLNSIQICQANYLHCGSYNKFTYYIK